MTTALMFMFLALLALGIPIFLALGTTSLILFYQDDALLSYAQRVIDELNSVPLLAVPYFVIAATFMERGGIARALVDAAQAWVGEIRGGVGLVAIMACALFATMSGSSVATAIAMGTILIPAMLRSGYSASFSSGVVASAGTLGILIPPSLAFVVYGVLADVSIPRLFLAGVVPALLQTIMISAYIIWFSRRNNYAITGDALSRKDKFRHTLRALPALSLPIIVLGGLYGGFVTLSESAALSAIVAFLLALFVYRGMALRDTLGALAAGVRNAAVIMIIVAVALPFGHWITESGIGAKLVGLLQAWDVKGWQFLLFLNVVLLFLGMFLEVLSVLMIIMPLILPLLEPLGINPIHFGVLVVVNMEIALLSPPLGLNLFVVSDVGKIPLVQVIRGTLPFFVLLLGLLLMVTYIPELSLWLPNLLMPPR
ncbi:TRAP transporter large permease [Allopusillimonas ginsengisoli]|uniref:TRAP transporter large permease n=1 Tax=Allopusillimonas ginsengisoli TaxID=453575 RepID=UPI0010C1FA7B|nr:TRAP transporter large permease [Allopusillimonas ginsengisoli]